jgi:acyl-CoA reductase-like NAD-dependent aldehyde dehydrogenase
MTRLDVTKTHKLYVGGKFVRSESGRSLVIRNDDWEARAHLCQASRKDLRDAVRAAEAAQPGWAARDAYNRSQILYRFAEMLEARRAEFVEELARTTPKREAEREFAASVDRLVAYAGWCDKYQQILGCRNPVAGPYHNFTMPEPTGVVGVVAPDAPALLAFISLIAPPLAAGNTVIALSGSTAPIIACLLAEVAHTSDVPPGVLNILTGDRAELVPWFGGHRGISAINAADLPTDQAKALRMGAAENLKRVRVREIAHDSADQRAHEGWYDEELMESPWMIEPFVEMKTIWHPSAT